MPLVLFAVSVTAGMPFRSGAVVLPWLKMTIPTAPAAAAFSAFSSKVQVPRRSKAMFPAGKPAKSAASQPLVDVLPRPSWRSTFVTFAVTSPGSVWLIAPKSTPSTYVTHAGRRLQEGRGTNLREREVIERRHDRVVACRLERVDHVGDGLVVARQTREPVAAVGVRDLL